MAGRIPQSFIDDLLSRIDIVEVIDGYVPLRRTGKDYKGLCPFHDEKTPSFTVSRDKQFYHCFGCGANGTAISFLMEHGGMEFVEAVEDLAARAGVDVPREGGETTKPRSDLTEHYELMEMVVRFYTRQLRENNDAPRAIKYLKQRGLTGELAAEYELGFAPPGWDNLLRELGQSKEARQRLEKTGMLLKKSAGAGYYDRFRERIMFPIRDQRGRAIGFGGRVLSDENNPKYLNSPETPIFHKGRELYGLYQARNKLRDMERIYIVEGYMDVLALAQNGIPNAVATLGTAVTNDHLDRLFRNCSQLVFCFDGDTAGGKAAWRALEIALPFLRDGRQCFFMFMPEGKDPDDFVRQHGKTAFEDSEQYLPLSDYLLRSLRRDVDLTTREGQASFAERAVPYLAKLPRGALQELLVKDVARLSQLSVEDMKTFLHYKQPPRKRPASPVKQNAPGKRDITPVSQAIRLLLTDPSIAVAGVRESLVDIDTPGAGFLRELLEYIENHPNIYIAHILEHWRGSKYEPRLKELAAMENPLNEREEIETEFAATIDKIRKTFHKEQRQKQARQVENLEELRRLYARDRSQTE